jgi:hypothetical protein
VSALAKPFEKAVSEQESRKPAEYRSEPIHKPFALSPHMNRMGGTSAR